MITDIEKEEWVSCIRISSAKNLIYAAHENNLSIFDYVTGKTISKLYNLHNEPISAIEIEESHGYLFTGGKNGKIKIWNSIFNCLFEVKAHYQTITSLEVITISLGYKFLLSSSNDSYIRMWDMDTGQCINKINTNDSVNGIKILPNGSFCSYSNEKISIWTLSRIFTPFSSISSPISSMKRIKIGKLPAKILGYGINGSVVVLNPRTGEKLLQAYPSPKDVIVNSVIYDPLQGLRGFLSLMF